MNENNDLFGELMPVKDKKLEEILSQLLNEDDIELKTEIDNPLTLAQLKLIAVYLKQEGFEDSGQLIESFIQHLLKYMVSHNRESRKEIIQAITAMLKKEETTTTQKLMGEQE